ncbi:MAG: recombination regulator RecX [Pseudomonadota bacterium]
MSALKISLKSRALRYLALREHSRLELARKLSRHAQEGDDVEALLDVLEAGKLLSEERFSEALIHRRAARFGNQRILSELQGHGIDGDVLTGIQAGLAEDENARALAVWGKKFGRPPADMTERARQLRFLQQRGFSHAAIKTVMRSIGETDPVDDD